MGQTADSTTTVSSVPSSKLWFGNAKKKKKILIRILKLNNYSFSHHCCTVTIFPNINLHEDSFSD